MVYSGVMQANGYLTIRLSDSEREKLATMAQRNERSMSAEVRIAIREHLTKESNHDR